MSRHQWWEINYRRKDGEQSAIIRPWPTQPGREDAAIMLRDALLPSPHSLPEAPPDVQDKTVYQLHQLGIEITGIRET